MMAYLSVLGLAAFRLVHLTLGVGLRLQTTAVSGHISRVGR